MTAATLAAPPALPGQLRRPFAPDLGLCGTFGDRAALERAGIGFLEVSCRQWLVPDQPAAAFAANLEQLRSSAVPVRAANSFLPGLLACTGPGADHDAVLAYAEVAFDRAAQAGIGTITFGSGAARSVPGGFPKPDAELQLTALLARLADRARRWSVTVALEPLQSSETNFVNRVAEARRLVAAVDHPNLRITADLFHMKRESEGPDALREAGALIHHVHLAEHRARTAPGVDGDDFTPYFRALRDIGYRGGLSIECRWSDLSAQLPEAVATLKRQLAGLVDEP